jgi:hypothetical protein
MFLAGEGWQDKMKFVTTVAGQVTVPVTPDMAMIKEVRFLFGGIYVPMVYDDANRQPQTNPSENTAAYPPARYRIVDNQFYFNPPLFEGGTDYLQIEYMSYPKRVADDHDVIEGQFYKPFQHWAVYWCASRLVAGIGKPDPDWGRQEAAWYLKIKAVIDKRNMQTTVMREFEG